jgi:hypothetical protein
MELQAFQYYVLVGEAVSLQLPPLAPERILLLMQLHVKLVVEKIQLVQLVGQVVPLFMELAVQAEPAAADLQEEEEAEIMAVGEVAPVVVLLLAAEAV